MDMNQNQKPVGTIEENASNTYEQLMAEVDSLKSNIDNNKSNLKKEELDSLRLKVNGILPYQGLKMFFSITAVFLLIMFTLVLLNTFWTNQAMKASLIELSTVSELVKEGQMMNYDLYAKTIQEMIGNLDFFGVFVGLVLVISLFMSAILMMVTHIQSKKVKVNDDEA